jgi:cytochrome c553
MIKTLATSMLILLAAASLAHAADLSAGKTQYEATCAACHGANGISIAPIYPDLAGQKAPYLVEQLKAFRDGSRQNPIMAPMARPLTDADIVNLANFLSTLTPQP